MVTLRYFESKRAVMALFAVAALALSGCATSAPTAEFKTEIKQGAEVRYGDAAKVAIIANGEIPIIAVEKDRLAQEIEAKIAAKQHSAAQSEKPRSFEIDVTLTEYEKGNAFARGMMAGLGQIHIAGDVKVLQLPDKTEIGAFTVRKTFAWGGMYGASVTMETVEESFAEGVAAAVTSQPDDGQKPKA